MRNSGPPFEILNIEDFEEDPAKTYMGVSELGAQLQSLPLSTTQLTFIESMIRVSPVDSESPSYDNTT